MTPYKQDILSLFNAGLDLSFLKGQRIMVAGASGLIGSCIIDILMLNPQRDYEVYALGRNVQRMWNKFGDYLKDPDFTTLGIDITKPIDGGYRMDYIIDAASNASPNAFKNNPVEVMKANIYGVSNLIDFGMDYSMKRMVYVSSGEIYGEGNGKPFTEKDSGYVDCVSLRACYPSSKRAAETLCIAYAKEYQANVVIARLCHTYGPGFTESDNRVYAQFIRNVLRGEDIVLKSKGEQYRSWLYVVDAANAILQLLHKGENCNAYNVADSNSNVTIRELAERISIIAGKKVVFDIPSEQQHGITTPITKAVFDTSKIGKLGWKPLFSLETGLRHTVLSTCS